METSTSKYTLITLFTILAIVSKTVALQRATTTTTTTTIYTDFLKTSCKATTYPDLCYNSLLAHTSDIQTSPKLLANASLSVALDTTRTTCASMSTMRGLGVRPREAGPMRDCLELLNDSIVQLRNSIKEMSEMKGSSNHGLLINDVQTWVSAALTNEDTCMEGFGGKYMDGKLKNVVRGKIMVICHLTSNSLALINNFASLQHG
ncbi:hypothetical protein vseg_014612 [Gypsophila vaccaria]